MNHLFAVALGGAFGAAMRFLISTGVYQWLGRGFPYGTLAVNLIGSLLIGLMTVALPLQRVALTMEYRSAILVGLFGSLTTFSTFSLDNFYLLEQGQFIKAGINMMANVVICLLAVWLGLSLGKILFSSSAGILYWREWVFPYALWIVNTLGAFLIALVCTFLLSKITLSEVYLAALLIVVVSVYMSISSLYIVLSFIEYDMSFNTHLKSIIMAVSCNLVLISSALWLGFVAGK